MKTHTITTYSFDELNEDAKARAIDTHRYINVDYEWWDCDYDDFKTIAKILGIDIDNIWFSGFASQGDGLCFEGSFCYSKEWRKRLEEYAPKTWKCPKCGKVHDSRRNKEYHVIGERLQEEQKRVFYGIYGTIKHRGHYNHSGCTYFDVRHNWDSDVNVSFDPEDIGQIIRELMDVFYYALERQFEWLTADEQIIDTFKANEYEFKANGDMY